MSSVTPNYGLIKPGVGDPTDQDLWGGYLNDDMDTIDTTMKSISDATKLPVGSLYFNASDATNPATLLGYGTWVAFGQGVVILGVGTGTDGNGDTLTVTAGATGGEYEHTLTTSEVPPVSVTIPPVATFATTNPSAITGGTGNAGSFTATTAGGGAKHNNIQPYIGVYVWKRTA